MARWQGLVISVVTGALALGCGTADDGVGEGDDGVTEVDAIFPGVSWQTAAPEDMGFDAAALDGAADYGDDISGHCLLVVRDGVLVHESYFESGADDVHNSWSIAKTFTAALVGVAIQRGDIDNVEQSAADYIPSWRGSSKEGVRIHNLLAGDSGIKHDMIADYGWTVFTHDQTSEANGYPHHEWPGYEWKYNNHAVQNLHTVLENATGMDPEDYARAYLWEPIGMSDDTRWGRDHDGNPTMYSSVHLTCRDAARFGHLLLNGANWDGEQLIDAEYVGEMLSPSQEMNRAYGYLTWLNGEAPAIGNNNRPFATTMFPHAPSELFSAQGVGQNFIDVLPSSRTVYVFLRPSPHQNAWNFVFDLFGTIEDLLRDGEQRKHRKMLDRLLAAG